MLKQYDNVPPSQHKQTKLQIRIVAADIIPHNGAMIPIALTATGSLI
jgi:hypothetical protein